jgi:simple sugar transport system permease protein
MSQRRREDMSEQSENSVVTGAQQPPKRESFGDIFRREYVNVGFVREVRDMVMAFVFAFVLGAVLIVLANPAVVDVHSAVSTVGTAYKALLQGAFGSFKDFGTTTAQAVPLIAAGLGVAIAFRVGLFNIGGQGQAIWGATAAAFIGFTVHAPAIIHLPLAVLAGLVGGAAWGGIAGILRAKLGANEVIVTIMLNYVASGLLYYLLMHQLQNPGRPNPVAPNVDTTAAMPFIPDTRYHLGFLIVIAAALVVWWLLDHTKLGFAIRAVGGNPSAAATAGMNVPLTLTLVMLIGGSLCGLAGAMTVLGPNAFGETDALSRFIVGSVGFDAITVALLGRSKPLGTVMAGLLFGALKAGSLRMQGAAQTPGELASVIQAFIVMFVAAPALVRTLMFVNRSKKERQPKVEVVAGSVSDAAVEVVSA